MSRKKGSSGRSSSDESARTEIYGYGSQESDATQIITPSDNETVIYSRPGTISTGSGGHSSIPTPIDMETPAGLLAAPPPPLPPPSGIPGLDILDFQFLENQMDRTYEIVRPLTSGSYGCVYEGIRHPENQRCAVKVIKAGALNSNYNSIQREVNVVNRLINNTNDFILSFFEVLSNAALNRVYIGSELSATGDLFNYMVGPNIQTPGVWLPMQEIPAMYLIRCVARGLQHLHGLGIAHGDLKPENILLFPTSSVQQFTTNVGVGHFVPKLCDFSNSRQRSATDPPDQIMARYRICTLNYSPPEADTGAAQPYDLIKADVYSLGCTLLSILLGGIPFSPKPAPIADMNERKRLYELQCTQQKTNRDYVTKMIRSYSCSEALKDLLLRTLTVDPSVRISLHKFLIHQWFVNR